MQSLPADIEIYTTGDGSPTLVFRRTDGYVEKMHHSGGALAESLYIYGQALELALKTAIPPRVISLGLGLGYNELITLAALQNAGVRDFKVWSFEALPVLREAFLQWSDGGRTRAVEKAPPLAAVVADVADRVAVSFSSASGDLRALVRQAIEDGRLELRSAFPDDASGVDNVNLVYYDAYSNKMDPHLWAEDLLTVSLGARLGTGCILATYAATGALNRSLKALGFRPIPKTGFQGKRQCTLAIRGTME